jgi:hypothetical protein
MGFGCTCWIRENGYVLRVRRLGSGLEFADRLDGDEFWLLGAGCCSVDRGRRFRVQGADRAEVGERREEHLGPVSGSRLGIRR